jgi:outer membrane protein
MRAGGRSALFALAFWAAGVAFAQNAPIWVVDMARLANEAPQMRAAQARIAELVRSGEQQIAAEEANLAELRARKLRQGDLISRAELEQLDARIAATERSIRRLRDEQNQRVTARRNQLLVEVERSIQEAVAEEARERGIDVVLSQDAAVYAHPRLDLTEAVLQRLKETPPQ